MIFNPVVFSLYFIVSALELYYSFTIVAFNILTFISLCTQYLEKVMAPHSSTLAWKISWAEEPGGLQSMGSPRVGHDWSDLAAAAAGSCVVPDHLVRLSLFDGKGGDDEWDRGSFAKFSGRRRWPTNSCLCLTCFLQCWLNDWMSEWRRTRPRWQSRERSSWSSQVYHKFPLYKFYRW